MNDVLRHLRKAALLCAGQDLSDAQLLESFLARREGAAFETLLRRHGPMVLGVCRRLLRNHHDAEDAFQATFLVLARKAGSVRSRRVLASWLYGVAYRTSLKARAMNAKRRARERQSGQRPRPEAGSGNDELLARLDEELHRLPEKLRVAVVLCELEGKGRREAARTLGWPEGTLSCRLAQARKLLARRLGRDAEATRGGAFVAVPALGAVPPALVKTTARAAAGGALAAGAVSAEVMTLVDGVLKAMLVSKLKVAGVVALVLAVGVPIGLTYSQERAPRAPLLPRQAPQDVAQASDDLDALRLEFESLRKEVRALRERVKALERTAPTRGASGTVRFGTKRPDRAADLNFAPAAPGVAAGPFVESAGADHMPRREPAVKRTGDPVEEAEAALRRLRADPDDRAAAEALERAARQMRERGKPQKYPPQDKP